MQTLIEALPLHAALVVNRFYDELSRLPTSRRILDIVSAEELADLKARQIENLVALADPGLTPREHAGMATRIGHIYAIAGLGKEELARSHAILQELMHKLIGRQVGGEARALYARRLTEDLAWQLKAYQDVQDSQQEVLLRVTRLVWAADSYTDFIHQLIGTLASHAEITACVIGRPDEAGIFHFEAGSGGNTSTGLIDVLTLKSHAVSVRADHPQGQGAIGRAWRSGKTERVVNYETDPLVQPWRDVAKGEGLRSSVAIPIAEPGQRPMAIVLLFSAYPGGFVGPHQTAFIDLLQTLLGCVAMRIQTLDGVSEAVPVNVRQHWAALVRTGALEMHYQPLLNLSTWRVGKVEALARLRDGERLLMPDEFLSALASDDLLALYTRGLEEAMADRSRWQRDGLDLEISVNLPPAALNDIRYFEATRCALAAHECPPARLTLEILENESISLNQGQRAILARFRALGILLAQDDLGSAHSGLARLRELPFDWIKIDREIAWFSGDDALEGLRLIYQLTRLGHALGKLVLAEGIDTFDLLYALAILGVDGAQGYVIAKPMEPARLREWMARQPSGRFVPSGESLLARLARFVIWEERVALIAAVPGVAPRLLAMPDAKHAPDPAVDEFAGSLADFDEILPAGDGQDHARRALLHALLIDGRHSDAYREAVQRLMTALAGAAAWWRFNSRLNKRLMGNCRLAVAAPVAPACRKALPPWNPP